MLTIDVLHHDCFIPVFMYLDFDSLINVVTVNKDQHLAAARTVYQRKFRSECVILDSSCASTVANYLLALNYFGDLMTKLTIKVPLPQMRSILKEIHDRCHESLNELKFWHADTTDNNDPAATQWFFRNLDDFKHLRSLHCKYGDLHSDSGRLDRLAIRIPRIPSLTKLKIDGFGGRLQTNSIKSIRSNQQIEEFSLYTGYENLHASYVKFIGENLVRLKALDLRFAVMFPMDAGLVPMGLNLENLEKLRVLCYFNSAITFLPFYGDTMNKLEDVDYTATTTNFQLINLVSQFKQLKRLKIGSYGVEDEHLTILADNLTNLDVLNISDLPCKQPTPLTFTANGVREFLDVRNDIKYLYIAIKEINYEVNMELISDIKQILLWTQWTVSEKNLTGDRCIVIFNE